MEEQSLGRLFQSAYNLSPPDATGGPGCSGVCVAATSGSGSDGSNMDHRIPVQLDLDDHPLSRLFAESDHDDDEDDLGLDDSFARAVAGKNHTLMTTINTYT